LSKKIDSLPPLPKTIIDLEEFKKSSNKDLDKLLTIIEQDPLIVATLLKVANSAMFGFNNKVETASRALHLLGVNFTLSIAFGSAIKNAFDTDLGAYDINADGFLRLANMSSNLLATWLGKTEHDLKEELLLPVFLLETGRFVLSSVAVENGRKDDFLKSITNDPLNISNIEREYFNATSTDVTSSIFKYWNLSEKLIHIIEYTDNLKNCPEKYIKEAQVLSVIKTICNVCDPMGDKFIEAGIAKAADFGLDTNNLEKAIEKMQDRMLEE
ncbi:MAG: HDOD domain-containing protein, partial [Campylobacterota bacterium]|nr:HDOD domain-containing protein [Campylobacterota bacterium]